MPDLRLKYQGTGLPAQYPDKTYRAAEGRPFPLDILYGYHEPPTLSFTPEGVMNRATYKFRISMHDVKRFVPHALGFAEVQGAGLLDRTLPFNDPDEFGMICVGIPNVSYVNESGYNPKTGLVDPHFQRITTFDPALENGEAMKKYRYALMTCEFAHVPYHLDTDANVGTFPVYGERARYMTSIQTASTEYVSLDRAIVFWADANCPAFIAKGGPVQVATGAGLLRALSEIVTTWYRVPAEAIPALAAKWKPLLGTVNDKEFVLPFYNATITYPLETMMFQPWRLRERMGPLGNPEYDVELRWLNRDFSTATETKGWNHFLYPNDGQYYRVSWGGGPVPIYPRKDHDTAFQVL